MPASNPYNAHMLKSALILSTGLAAGFLLSQHTAPAAAPGQKPQTVADFPDLGKGLMETPGCLGVQSAHVRDGKLAIFAWFENKKAVERWYYSKMHQDAMKQFFPGSGQKKPLALFKDEKAPIMMIATVTPGGTPAPGTNLAIKQIAIEAYTP